MAKRKRPPSGKQSAATEERQEASTTAADEGPEVDQEEKSERPSQLSPGGTKHEVDLSPQGLAKTITDFLDLVVRVSAGEESEDARADLVDRDLLSEIQRRLAGNSSAMPRDAPKKRFPILDPIQEALGCLRLNFNTICTYAAKLDATDVRDTILIGALVEACAKSPLGGHRLIDVTASTRAILQVRDEALARIRDSQSVARLEDEEALARVEKHYTEATDWLYAVGKRPSSMFTAGELLARVAKESRLPAVASRTSTDIYAKRLQALGLRKRLARRTNPAEYLTYLATAFGVPVRDAPFAAFRMGCTIQDHLPADEVLQALVTEKFVRDRSMPGLPPLSETQGADPKRLFLPFAPTCAKKYERLEIAEWRGLVDRMKKEFALRGFSPDSESTELDATLTLQNHFPALLPVSPDFAWLFVEPKSFWEKASQVSGIDLFRQVASLRRC